MAYGIMHTPPLVIDERVVAPGRIPTKDELKGRLREAMGKTSRLTGGDRSTIERALQSGQPTFI